VRSKVQRRARRSRRFQGLATAWPADGGDRQPGPRTARTGGEPALDSLRRSLPPLQQSAAGCRWHRCARCCSTIRAAPATAKQAFADGLLPPVAIIAANADGSLTLAQHVVAGSHLLWAIRLPEGGAADMRRSLARSGSRSCRRPLAAIALLVHRPRPLSLWWRRLDLACLRELLPQLPLIGAYGTGQIAPSPARRQPAAAERRRHCPDQQTARRSDVQPEP
jgi:hypothetical protein